MRRILILLCLLIITIFVFAQTPPDTLWSNTFGGYGDNKGYSIKLTSDDGFIIAGYTESFGSGGKDFWLIKTDANGNEEWNQTYGGISDEIPQLVQQTDDNGYIIVGLTWSFGAGEADCWVVKTDSLGNEEWNNSYGGPGGDHGESIKQTPDGGYIITGAYEANTTAFVVVWLLKIDSLGNVEWDQTFGNSGANVGYSLLLSNDGGYLISGFKSNPDHDFWLIKTDIDGNMEWDQTFDYGIDQARDMKKTSDNGFILAGTTHDFIGGHLDCLLVKTDSLGNEEWNQVYGGDGSEITTSVIQDTDNGFIVAGLIDDYNPINYDIWLLKTDELGDFVWDLTLGDDLLNEQAMDIELTPDNNYIMTGRIAGDDISTSELLILELGYNSIIHNNICEVQSNSLYNYPNPFNPTTIISFSINNDNDVELEIFNIKGQKVATLINKHLSKGDHSIVWNGDDDSGKSVSSGIYYYKLKINGKAEAIKKCLLLK